MCMNTSKLQRVCCALISPAHCVYVDLLKTLGTRRSLYVRLVSGMKTDSERKLAVGV